MLNRLSCGKLSKHGAILGIKVESSSSQDKGLKATTMNKLRHLKLTFTSGKLDTSSFDPWLPVTQRPNIFYFLFLGTTPNT